MAKAQFRIELWPLARTELNAIRVFERRSIISAMHEQLTYEPMVPTRNRKPLGAIPAAFAYKPPLWELRVGEYRVFYDVDLFQLIVNVRSVRHKPAGKTTEEVLR